MAQVAERAGVSHQTVSRVLNDASLVKEETRLRVLAAIEELGYRRNFAARLLATNRSRRIGMVTAHLALHGPSMIALAVQEAGEVQGYDVSLVGLPEFSFESLQHAVDRLSDQAAEAIVVAVPHKDAVEMTRSLQPSIPVVMVQGVVAGQPLSAGIDQEAGARMAVGHLLDLGHRRVAHVSGPCGLDRGAAARGAGGGHTRSAACSRARSSRGTGRRRAATGRAPDRRRTRT